MNSGAKQMMIRFELVLVSFGGQRPCGIVENLRRSFREIDGDRVDISSVLVYYLASTVVHERREGNVSWVNKERLSVN